MPSFLLTALEFEVKKKCICFCYSKWSKKDMVGCGSS